MTLTLTVVAEPQTTTDCTRIGIMLNCTTMPLGPSGGVGGTGGFLQGFADSYLRAREQSSRESERAANIELLRQQTELLRQQTEQLRQQQSPARASLFVVPPRFSLGDNKGGSIYAIRMESSNPPIADHEMTEAELKMCLADPVCGGTLSAFTTALREQGQKVEPPPTSMSSATPPDKPTSVPSSSGPIPAPTGSLTGDLTALARLHFEEGQRAYSRGDYSTAYSEWKSVIEEGRGSDAQSALGIGLLYLLGRGVPRDDAQAARWFRRAAEQGDATAQANLGFMCQGGRGVPQDDAEAVKWYRRGAAQESAAAQNNLGAMYSTGRGITRDDAQAVEWYRRAADKGYALAQGNLGFMYEVGRGVIKDEHEAVIWYQRSAAQGNPASQAALGWMYLAGRGGLAKDDAQALELTNRAAEQGNARGQNNLGSMYWSGRGVRQDDAEAVKWFQRAADQGWPIAHLNLGNAYSSGRGVQKDPVLAYMWYSLAARGFSDGEFRERVLKGRERVGANLSSEQAARAERMAQSWQPKPTTGH
jgi:TPR repeat protein